MDNSNYLESFGTTFQLEKKFQARTEEEGEIAERSPNTTPPKILKAPRWT